MDVNTAKNDYAGKSNTQKIISQLGDEANAAKYANSYTFPNGDKGYLGSAGEWVVVDNNKDIINSLLTVLGYPTINPFDHWTSSPYTNTMACYASPNSNLINVKNRTESAYIRPFCELIF